MRRRRLCNVHWLCPHLSADRRAVISVIGVSGDRQLAVVSALALAMAASRLHSEVGSN